MKKRLMSIFLAFTMLLSLVPAISLGTAAGETLSPTSNDVNVWDGTSYYDEFDEGDGTAANPYLISDAEQLAYLANRVNAGDTKFNSKCYKLTADIYLNDTTNYENWATRAPANSWTSIGTVSNKFSGTFDGDGYVVYGLYIKNAADYQGLFGYSSGTIQNLGVEKSYISAKKYSGGVCGYNGGSITNCYNTSSVSGSDYDVGGVCGHNQGTISNCYNTGTVSGSDYDVGGVCGANYGSITNCYNTGAVSATGDYVGGICGYSGGTIKRCANTGAVSGSSYEVGGICGYAYSGTITNCYNAGTVSGLSSYVGGVCGYNRITITNCYNTGSIQGTKYVGGVCGYNSNGGNITNCYNIGTVTGTSYAEGVCGRTWGGTSSNCYYLGTTTSGSQLSAEDMASQASYTGFDFTENTGVWLFLGSDYYKYPVLRSFVEWTGEGTEADPYIISTPYQLAYLAGQVNSGNTFSGKYFKLVSDIYLNDTTNYANWATTAPANSWTAIGTNDHAFYGTFDGDGYVIYGLYIKSTSMYQGLFGYSKGTIQNLGVDKSYYYVTDKNVLGGVCGKNEGAIKNCYNAGTVSGKSYVGGVCGSNTGTIINCYNTGAVNGVQQVGGVLGSNSGGTITNCYNTGAVSGSAYYLGGVCGYNGYNNSSTITNCYNTGAVSGSADFLGGVCGRIASSSTITNCYNTGAVSGSSTKVGGVCGSTEDSSTITNCYNTGVVTGDDYVGGVCGKRLNPSTITNCYNTGAVNGTGTYVGGVCGYYIGSAKNCYYLGTTTSGSQLSANDMVKQASYTGFDFTANTGVWLFLGSDYYKYPVLRSFVEWTGEGTEADPYIISTPYQLAYLAGQVNSGNTFSGKYFKLVSDIYLNDTTNYANWATTAPANSWTPIGKSEKLAFSGTFDGDGHVVYGVYIKNSTSNQGLFGYSVGGTIQNLGVEESYIFSSGKAGGVCGYNNKGTITNCYNTGIVSGSAYLGGVCGYNNYGTITNCYNIGTVSGSNGRVGGVCGMNSYATITNCYNTGAVNGAAYSGGVCGETKGSITNCYNTGAVSGSDDHVGGVCGMNSYATITNCYNTGTVSGLDTCVGGVCGSNGNDGYITNCYNTGSVSGTSFKVGGVCGHSRKNAITNCYYVIDCAKDGSATVQNGLGAEPKGSVKADVLGQTTPYSDANMKASEGTSGSLVDTLNANASSIKGASKWTVDSSVNSGYPTLTGSDKIVVSIWWSVEDVDDVTYDGSNHTPTVVVKEKEGASTITLTLGTDYTVKYSKDTKNAGTVKITIIPADQTKYMGKIRTTFDIEKVDITLTSGSSEKASDGSPLTNSTVTVTSGGFVGSETVTYTVTGSQTDVGESKNTFTINWGNVNANNYNVTKVEGTLTVKEKAGISAIVEVFVKTSKSIVKNARYSVRSTAKSLSWFITDIAKSIKSLF